MGAGTTQETKTLDRVIELAGGVAGITASRANQGYKRFTDAQNFEDLVQALTVETQGYFAAWIRRAQRADELENRRPTFQIVAELVVRLAKDSSSDMNSAWDFALGLLDELRDTDNYTGEQAYPIDCQISLHHVSVVEDRGLVIFDLGAYGNGGLTFFN